MTAHYHSKKFSQPVFLSVLLMILFSCSRSEQQLGIVGLNNSNSVSIETLIPSHSYPSRVVHFGRVDSDSMLPFNEPVYTSDVVASVTNLGNDNAIIVVYEKGKRLKFDLHQGKTQTLPKTAFKNFRVAVVPAKNKTANLRFRLVFDKSYTSSGWQLLSGWSDGP